MEVRASSLPRIAQCPASIRPPECQIVEGEDAGRDIGSAVHDALCWYIQQGESDLGYVADRWDVDADQIAPLYHVGRKIWDRYEPHIGPKTTETEYTASRGNITLTGHPDVVAEIEPDHGLIIDWKTGSPSPRYRWQLRAYWALTAERYDWQRVTLMPVFLRSQRLTKTVEERLDVEKVWDTLEYASIHPQEYSPGADTCEYCPRRHECEALSQQVATACQSLQAEDKDVSEYSAEELARLYPMYRQTKKRLKEYKDTLKTKLAAEGPVEADGHVLSLDEREREKIAVVQDAWDILCDEWNIEDAQDVLEQLGYALKISKTRLLKTVDAEYGQKAETREQLMDRLRRAGAVDVSSYSQIVEEASDV